MGEFSWGGLCCVHSRGEDSPGEDSLARILLRTSLLGRSFLDACFGGCWPPRLGRRPRNCALLVESRRQHRRPYAILCAFEGHPHPPKRPYTKCACGEGPGISFGMQALHRLCCVRRDRIYSKTYHFHVLYRFCVYFVESGRQTRRRNAILCASGGPSHPPKGPYTKCACGGGPGIRFGMRSFLRFAKAKRPKRQTLYHLCCVRGYKFKRKNTRYKVVFLFRRRA